MDAILITWGIMALMLVGFALKMSYMELKEKEERKHRKKICNEKNN